MWRMAHSCAIRNAPGFLFQHHAEFAADVTEFLG